MASTPSSEASPPPPAAAPATWTPPAPRGPVPVTRPPWLDYGMLIIGIGALLMFIGFLFGAGAAGQTVNGTANTYQGDLEAFFTLNAFGILLVVGGWLYRVAMTARAKLR